MSEDVTESEKRLAIARRVAKAYASNTNLVAMTVAGSTGAGLADRYSDLELDCYWSSPPTDDERAEPIATLVANDEVVWPYDEEDEEWSEDYEFEGVQVGISGFLVSDIARCIEEVVSEANTDVIKQLRLAAIQRSVPLSGNVLIEHWREKIEKYPDDLVDAVIDETLDPILFPGWQAREALVARGDDLAVHELLAKVERRVLTSLFALNRTYVSSPIFKWQRSYLASFEVLPRDAASRLESLWVLSAADAIREAEELLDETAVLAATHSRVDLDEFRESIRERRTEGT